MREKKHADDLDSRRRPWLEHELRRTRSAIREHRDAKGDDRCHLDDALLYHKALGVPLPKKLPSKETFMETCRRFIKNRQCPFVPVRAEAAEPQQDYDIYDMTEGRLRLAIVRLRKAVWAHRQKGIRRTWRDDIALYRFLPDQVAYDTRLPDGMLENCRRFYDKKARERRPRLHEW